MRLRLKKSGSGNHITRSRKKMKLILSCHTMSLSQMKKKGFLPKKDTEKDDQRDEYVTGRLTNVFVGKPKSLISTFLTFKPDFNHDRKFVSVSVKNQGIGDNFCFHNICLAKSIAKSETKYDSTSRRLLKTCLMPK